ncbi:hypothetical protein ACFLYU_01085 [Candidatus Dependentiae bacterium]
MSKFQLIRVMVFLIFFQVLFCEKHTNTMQKSNKKCKFIRDQYFFKGELFRFFEKKALLSFRLLNKEMKENISIYSEEIRPIKLKKVIDFGRFYRKLKKHKNIDLLLSIELSSFKGRDNPYVDYEEAFKIMFKITKELCLLSSRIKDIPLEDMYKSKITKLKIKGCDFECGGKWVKKFFKNVPKKIENLIIESSLNTKYIDFSKFTSLKRLRLGKKVTYNRNICFPKKLMELDISGSKGKFDFSEKAFVRLLKNIRHLKVYDLKKIPVKGLKNLPKNISVIYIENDCSDIVNDKKHKKKIKVLRDKGIKVNTLQGHAYPETKIEDETDIVDLFAN